MSTELSSRTTRLPVCGWNATLSNMPRSSLPATNRSTVGMVPVTGLGANVLGGFSTRHMISALTPLFSTTLLSVWLMRPVLAQHARNTPFSSGDGIDVHVFGPVVAREPLERLRVAQDDVAVGVHDAGAAEVHGDPRAVAGFGALAPVRRALRRDAQPEDRARRERRLRGDGDRAVALERDRRARTCRCRRPALPPLGASSSP